MQILDTLGVSLRKLVGPRDAVEVAEGNAFYSPKELYDAVVGCTYDEEEIFVRGVRAAMEELGMNTDSDPIHMIQSGSLPYTQAALAFLQCLAHEKAKNVGALNKLIARAGYSFGNYTLFMLGAEVSYKMVVQGAFVRGHAQEISCTFAGSKPPYRHLFSVPNNEQLNDILKSLDSSVFSVAIMSPMSFVIASRKRIGEEIMLEHIDGIKVFDHPPYHCPAAMNGAVELFRTWLKRNVISEPSQWKVPQK